MSKILLLLLTTWTVAAMLSCRGSYSGRVVRDLGIEEFELPTWNYISEYDTTLTQKNIREAINGGTGLYLNDWGRPAFLGVGTALHFSDTLSERSQAEISARTNLTDFFRSHIDDLVKVFSKQNLEDSSKINYRYWRMDKEEFEQQTSIGLSNLDLGVAKRVIHYYDAQRSITYYVVRFGTIEFEKQVRNAEGAVGRLHLYADKAFTELATHLRAKK
ncbi:MAG: hypothetical protein ACKVRP_01020 [Bacteroidota bacterium]